MGKPLLGTKPANRPYQWNIRRDVNCLSDLGSRLEICTREMLHVNPVVDDYHLFG